MAENTLNKELESSSISLQNLLGVLLLITVLVLSVFVGVRSIHAADPYTNEVLALVGDQERGQEIFQMNCAVCHGLEAAGEVGPSLLSVSARKSKVKLIKQVVSGKTPPMPQFQPVPQDMADLLQYLETL
ncbi:MAG: cytochrome c [Cyanobacteria bacterium P01_H01_bin.58]